MKTLVETPVVTLIETPAETSPKTLTDDKTAVDPRTILGNQAEERSTSSVVASTTQRDDLEEGELTDHQTQLGAVIVSRNVESVDDRCPPWQQSTSSVGDRLRFLFQNNEFSDCSVTAGVVGKQKTFACHKVILSMTSSKLKSILMHSNHVNLNLTQEVFEVLLQYMYLDSFKLSSVEAACEVYKAALQYDVPHLLKLTRDFMLKNLSPDNIWTAFDLAVECDDRQLKAGCSSSLAENPSSWNYLSDVKRTLLLFVLDLKTVNIQEITVLKAVDEWAMQQCIHLDIEPNLFNKRQIVGPEIMSKIRFLAITPQDFVTYCESRKSFLNTEEMFAILCWLTIPKSQNLPDWVCPLSISRGTSKAFRLKRRKNFSFAVQQNSYFTEAYALTGPAMNYHVGAKQFTTLLKVSKPIVLQGIQVPALWYPPFHQEQNRTYEEIYEIEIIDSENNLLTTATVVLDVQFASVVDIVFKEAVTLDSSVDYKINIRTSKMYFLTKEFRTAEMAEKVKFTFQDKVIIPDKSCRNEALQNTMHCGFILQIVFSVFL
ncbi:uncharacterized protein LOC113208366 [Frankliniella occidentalis]|uniref:Uncharacterized protein LOC113208366 n=1 Tax=Frankliniella occidentalis TaxID=133901 RepID=A0A6J1SRK6_FRAOC|nr:uncharacterized protein LOC113208366 [Frankliniella occidentalis]